MRAVPESVVHSLALDKVVFSNNLRSQIGMGVIDARIDDSDDNIPITASHAPSRWR